MPLRLKLKPHEKVVIGEALLTNGETTAEIYIENQVPILRQKDLLTETQADSPCKKIYFVVQLMYLSPTNLREHHQNYWNLVKPVVKASPSCLPLIDEISELILVENYYHALKKAKQLIAYEKQLIEHAKRSL